MYNIQLNNSLHYNVTHTGLTCTNYGVRYQHAVPLLRNKMPYSLLKTAKTHAIQWWGCSVLNALNLEKKGVKIQKCVLLLNFISLFWLYRMHLQELLVYIDKTLLHVQKCTDFFKVQHHQSHCGYVVCVSISSNFMKCLFQMLPTSPNPICLNLEECLQRIH